MKHQPTPEHPAPEEWMSFLYGEDAPTQHAALDAHLHVCPVCRAQVQRWRRSQEALDAWTLPAPARQGPRMPRRFLRWAAAAVVLIGVGAGLGRLTSPGAVELSRLRSGLEAELDAKLAATRSELTQILDRRQAELAQALRTAAAEAATTEASQLLARHAKLLEEQRDADHESYLAAFRQLDERRRTDVGTLREELQTVALNADDSLTWTQEQLLELASAAQPSKP
jgi:hypothetical protein